MSPFEALHRNLPKGAEENHKKHWPQLLVSGHNLNSGPPEHKWRVLPTASRSPQPLLPKRILNQSYTDRLVLSGAATYSTCLACVRRQSEAYDDL